MTAGLNATKTTAADVAPGQTPSVAPTLTVAVIQYQAVGPDATGDLVRANVDAHARLIQQAHADGARLVLFPELSLTGYELQELRGRAGAAGEPSPWLCEDDPRLGPLRDICARLGLTAIVGAALREQDTTQRLASLIVGPDASVLPAFKTHLHGLEQELFVAGGGPEVLVIDGWRIALAVCADAAHPSHAAAAAGAGADVYAVSALYVGGEETRLGLHLGERSMDHRMFGLLANLGGHTPLGESCGRSGTWGPDGLAGARAGGNGTEIVVSTLDGSSLDGYRPNRGR
ncbi:carbon-nitrogen hydrolase family protein [Paenarthrobacter sp. NPDC056912]|uniref:carbon-nitrogen hydrolase family protein n=1 Tax=Paenarthrobacter sp. NPDC056912 TaxID=3345965 RepID=UPI00366E1CE4